MNVLLVEPSYYTRYPPLGLLKIAAYYSKEENNIEFVRGCKFVEKVPDKIYVTSLFTYSWKPVHEAVAYYKGQFPEAELILGGIYATLMKGHAESSGADKVYSGLFKEAEDLLPDYSLIPTWENVSIVFSHRGCVNDCPYCAVPTLEPIKSKIKSIRNLVHPDHRRLILWDNNTFGMAGWKGLLNEIKDMKLSVDFNQGIDAEYMTEEVINSLSEIKIDPIRLAYDVPSKRKYLSSAISSLKSAGFDRRKIIIYTLYNWTDTPEQFFERIKDIMEWGVVAYPMRYEPLDSLKKNRHISKKWTAKELEMVARARRVIGYGGVFPPYEGLKKKICNAKSFDEAFELRPRRSKKKDVIEKHTEALSIA